MVSRENACVRHFRIGRTVPPYVTKHRKHRFQVYFNLKKLSLTMSVYESSNLITFHSVKTVNDESSVAVVR